jgi:anti-sigma-K factor RskA
MAETQLTREDADLQAAEYVIGLLDAEQHRAARRRLRTEPAFADDVGAWEQRFAAWYAAFEPVAAPADAWQRLQRHLGWTSHGGADPVSRGTPVAPTRGPWRGLALGGFALAALFAVALVFTLRRPAEQLPAPPPVVENRVVAPDMVASIASDDGRAMLVASIHSGSGEMTLAPAGDMDVPGDRAAELWLIPADGTPRSLGVIDPGRAGRMVIPEAMRAGLAADALLAVSIEPTGGSPTGQPTGPVVAKGAMHGV